MQGLLIEVSYDDQVYVENECVTKGYTLSSFFKLLLDDYRDGNTRLAEGLVEPTGSEDEQPKKRGRPRKVQAEDANNEVKEW